jgi:hypothetical protein
MSLVNFFHAEYPPRTDLMPVGTVAAKPASVLGGVTAKKAGPVTPAAPAKTTAPMAAASVSASGVSPVKQSTSVAALPSRAPATTTAAPMAAAPAASVSTSGVSTVKQAASVSTLPTRAPATTTAAPMAAASGSSNAPAKKTAPMVDALATSSVKKPASVSTLPPALLVSLAEQGVLSALDDALLTAMFAKGMPEAKQANRDVSASCNWRLRKRHSETGDVFKLTLQSSADGVTRHEFAFDPVRQQWSRQVAADELDAVKVSDTLRALIRDEIKTHGGRRDEHHVMEPLVWQQIECASCATDSAADDAAVLEDLTGTLTRCDIGQPAFTSAVKLPQLGASSTSKRMTVHSRRPVARSHCLDMGDGRPCIPVVSLARPDGAGLIWLAATRSASTTRLHTLVSMSLCKLVQRLQDL